MTLPDLIFLSLVVGLPILVAVRIFRNEPAGRPFLASYALSVIGTSVIFTIAAAILFFTGVGGLGMFDGIFSIFVSIPAALIIGLIVRRGRRASARRA